MHHWLRHHRTTLWKREVAGYFDVSSKSVVVARPRNGWPWIVLVLGRVACRADDDGQGAVDGG